MSVEENKAKARRLMEEAFGQVRARAAYHGGRPAAEPCCPIEGMDDHDR